MPRRDRLVTVGSARQRRSEPWRTDELIRGRAHPDLRGAQAPRIATRSWATLTQRTYAPGATAGRGGRGVDRTCSSSSAATRASPRRDEGHRARSSARATSSASSGSSSATRGRRRSSADDELTCVVVDAWEFRELLEEYPAMAVPMRLGRGRAPPRHGARTITRTDHDAGLIRAPFSASRRAPAARPRPRTRAASGRSAPGSRAATASRKPSTASRRTRLIVQPPKPGAGQPGADDARRRRRDLDERVELRGC